MGTNAAIFRKYDIRGIADRELTDEVAEAIGQAYVTIFDRSDLPDHEPLRIAVGRDARDSSPRLFEALARGLERAGAGVVDLGMIPTPLAYFSVFELPGVHGCIQITGSHNPAAYNGFKMMQGDSTLHGESIQAMCSRIESGALLVADGHPLRRSASSIVEEYIAWVKRNIGKAARRIRVVIDSGNGVGGVVAPELVREVFGADVIELFSEPDASFPNHHPDPTVPDNLAHLIEAVLTHEADLGVAYDGDADRIGVVDERGDIIWGDRLMVLLSRDVLARDPGATIIGEVKCSQTLYDDIAA
ncbi:MAG: phosphomannomutase/phosphoglucomutase, partial [Myxococcota bacterium]